MRRTFANSLLRHAVADNRIHIVNADMGYGMWNDFKALLPGQYVNCGAAEQAMSDIAVGLSLAGKIPVCYTISPFYLRAFETLRTYIVHEKLHVLLIGSGLYDDYKHDGISHNASDIPFLMEILHVRQYLPHRKEEIPEMVAQMLERKEPAFMGLRR